ncbi:ATP-binding protein [Micromonospora endolithica]|nr:AAA family ATPase [Micromonospora endolithica]TWJ22936.1 putative ATPase [Micromonospora endolithica]
MDLLERGDALADLHRLREETSGGGRIAIVCGEAGAGKSTLAHAFAAATAGRARLLWGSCDPLLTPRALGPLHDIARQAGGELRDRMARLHGDSPDGPAGTGLPARGAAFEALLEILTGPRQRIRPVVVVEDLHWADEATLDLVAFLGRRLPRCRALLLLTYRDDEIGPDHPLRTVLAGLPRSAVRRLELPPLSAAAVAELARRAGRSATSVYEVTGGNPLLVAELLATSAEGVPPTVRDLVLSRLSGISPAARAVAELVSVVPSAVEPAVLGTRAAGVDECLARGVLAALGDRVGFRHELLRRAVEESLSPVRRAALHAEVLATLGGRPGADPARMVHHAHHAGDPVAVLRWAPVAARRAAELGAYRQATAHYATALECATALPDADRAGLLEAYSVVAYLGGRAPDALSARRQALVLREARGDTAEIGVGLRWVSRLAWWTGRTAEARQAGVRAVEVLRTLPPGRELAMAYSNLSQLHMLADEAGAAVEWGERALGLARRCGDRETALHARVNIGSARLQRGEPQGVAELTRVYQEASAAGLDDHAGRALVNLACVSVDWADYDAAERAMADVLTFTAARDLDGYGRHVLGNRARLRLVRGDWAAALADADEALAGHDQPGGSLIGALTTRGIIAARRGQAGAYADLALAAERGHATDESQFVAPASAALSEWFWLVGDPDRAAAEAKRGLEVAQRTGQPWFLGELAFRLWRAGGLGAAPAGVAEPYRLLIDGDWRQAAEEWRARGCPYLAAEALSCGDADAAGEALAVFDAFGAVVPARRLRADLRRRGLRVPRGPRPSTAADPTGLTTRQLEVLRLLTDGLSNAQIAERLTVSAKTVDHHVSAVLGKLGVASRGRAVAAARDRGLV